MNAYLETAERAQAIRDRLDEDFRFRAAHDGFEDLAWTAEKSLAALLGEDIMVHAWIKQRNTDRFDHEGIIHALTPDHLLTAEYGSGVHGTARIEPLDHAALSIEIRWPNKGDEGTGRPMHAALTLSRPAGDLTIEVRNERGDETRVERLVEGVQYLKASMNGATTRVLGPSM